MDIARLESNLQQKEKQLMEELLRRAIAQNPDLAKELVEIKGKQEGARNEELKEKIRLFKVWEEKQVEEHRSQRHIKYNDSVNRNALVGIRRRCDYKVASRTQQLKMEYELYYKPYGIEPPFNPQDVYGSSSDNTSYQDFVA